MTADLGGGGLNFYFMIEEKGPDKMRKVDKPKLFTCIMLISLYITLLSALDTTSTPHSEMYDWKMKPTKPTV